MSLQQFHNPIIPGFAPDPSCIQVDGVFYLVNSSFYAFPGLPIYSSTNLQQWSHIGNAIHRPEQLSLDEAVTDVFQMGPEKTLIACLGLLAPTIRYSKGTFYVICTNATSDGADLKYSNFYVKTTDIWSGQWSDPIYYDFRGIDPSMFFDDDGRAYIQGSYRAGPVWDPQCTIGQFEVDIETGKAISDIVHIWKGALKEKDAEGPHVYKKDGFYYLLAAEAGTFEHHAITMARSTSIWGPFEDCPTGPVLCAYGTEEIVQHTGHGDLFQSSDGQWWCVCLGVRYEKGRYPLSRETFLTPVKWPTSSWPSIELPKLQFERTLDRTPKENGTESSRSPVTVELEDVFIRTPDLENYRKEDSTIFITPSSVSLSKSVGRPSFLGRRQRSVQSSATVRLDLTSMDKDPTLDAGLAIYKDERRHASIVLNPATAMITLELVSHKKAPQVLAQQHIGTAKLIDLRIQATATTYSFSFSVSLGSKSEWTELSSIDTNELATYDFTGPLFGIFAHAEEQGSDVSSVSFSKFSIS